MTQLNTMENVNFVALTDEELMETEGGDIFASVGNFVGSTWNTLYYSGRDFGRSIVNALMR